MDERRSGGLLYVANARIPTEKAHGYQIFKMCEALARSGLRVDLCVPRRLVVDESQRGDPFAYYQTASVFRLIKLWVVDGLGLAHYAKTRHYRLASLALNLTFALSLVAFLLLRGHRYRWFYTRDPLALIVLTTLGRWLGGQVYYEAHEMAHGKVLGRALRWALNRTDRVITVTSHLADLLVKQGLTAPTLVLADGVDLKNFDIALSIRDARRSLGLPDDVIIASFVGKFHTNGEEKGIPDILRASSSLLAEFPTLRFYFVGGPAERVTRYLALIKDLGAPIDRFTFLDKQPVQDVPRFLKASNILLMPHPWSEFYAYCVSPLKLFEYMSSRRPIVASKLPAIEEILQHEENALLGNPGDPASIAANIRRLLIDPRLGESLAEQAFRDVLKYTWDARAQAIYAELAATPHLRLCQT